MTEERRIAKDQTDLAPEQGEVLEGSLFITLDRVAQEILKAQARFDQIVADNRRLHARLDKSRDTAGRLREHVASLESECRGLRRKCELAEEETERSHTEAITGLLRALASKQTNHLLRRVLASRVEDKQLIEDLRDYFRKELDIALQGELGSVVTLTEENLHQYDVREAVDLPCAAQIIGRGVLFGAHRVLRTEVEPLQVKGADDVP